MRLRILITTAAVLLGAASSALADASDSSNWAGYAVHRAGVHFTRVIGTWHQPSAHCPKGRHSYSATWVGLGGYNLNSGALEQIGTEVDCSPSGVVQSSAWYELVPAPSTPIRFTVRPGDLIAASVSVIGRQVVVVLANQTRHRVFERSLRASAVDTTSAEWIEEAPSECISESSCQTLPLANFHWVGFGTAYASSASGHTGTVSDPRWNTTRIRLVPGGRRYVVYHGAGTPAGAASPGGLSVGGSAFQVRYTQVSIEGNPFLAPRAAGDGGGGYLVHSGRF